MRALFVHGLGRSPLSGWPLLWQLKRAGVTTQTFGYLAALESFAGIRQRLVSRITRLATCGDYVLIGHSLGGVLLRAAVAALPAGVRKPRHIFLLASPVKPSRLAQKFGANPVFRAITGDCGQLLGSGVRMGAIGPTTIPTTAIVGVRGLPFITWPFADEVNDGIVSLAEVSAKWLSAQVPVQATHSLLPFSRRVGEIILEKMNESHA
jgi:pimeloyl-ACP methyl ester carboxylesterase